MSDVVVGAGVLGGKGLYAGKDFAAGEVVLAYPLQPLDEAGYLALPDGEDLFVHSFGGRRYLYPAPARFVNHSEDPSCVQDFERCCQVARRPIGRGDPITIDATQETARELSTFLAAYQAAYQEAVPAKAAAALGALVAVDASVWRAGQPVRGRDAVVSALLDTASGPALGALSDVEWLVGTGRWEALCSAGSVTSDRRRHVSILLKVIAGNWQLVYQHTG